MTDYDRIIKPRRGLAFLNLKELWQYRELFWFLAWRDILVKYKQTYLGVAWAVLQPFLTMLIFTFVFGRLAGLSKSTPGVPYPVLILAGLIPWQFFSNAMSESSNAIVASARMISKIYFPRLIVPASSVISGLIDFAIGMALLVLFMVYYGVALTPRLLLLPVFFFVAVLAAFAVGFWLSALNVKYRDVKYIVPFFTRMGLYISPVGFTSQWVSEKVASKWFFVYSMNTIVGVIDGFRWCILGPAFEPYWPGFLASVAMILFLGITGAIYFRSTEKTFADLI